MLDLENWMRKNSGNPLPPGRGLHSFPFQLDFSSSVHRITPNSS
jgi:hypothetical protein